MYKNHNITSVRKVPWDQMWHVVYEIKSKSSSLKREAYDRVTQKEAIRVAETIWEHNQSIRNNEKSPTTSIF